MKTTIVNSKDEIIGYKERGTLNCDTDIYRVTALWITNSENQILLGKRALTKKQNPGKWAPAVAGTVEQGETYDSNIIKEAEEELGLNLKNIPPKKWIKTNTLIHNYKHFTQWYLLKLDKPLSYFHPNSEISDLKWFTEQELLKLAEENGDELVNTLRDIIEEQGLPEF